MSWLNWEGINEAGRAQMDFVSRLLKLRQEHIVFHRDRFFPVSSSRKLTSRRDLAASLRARDDP
jgi:pullulanase/glycogen debranching enzyme